MTQKERKAAAALKTAKNDMLQAAIQLKYDKSIQDRIVNAKTESEAQRALIDGRQRMPD